MEKVIYNDGSYAVYFSGSEIESGIKSSKISFTGSEIKSYSYTQNLINNLKKDDGYYLKVIVSAGRLARFVVVKKPPKRFDCEQVREDITTVLGTIPKVTNWIVNCINNNRT